MKIKNIFTIMLLLTSSMVFGQALVGSQAMPDQNLQNGLVAPQQGYQFQAGDTVIISKETTHYLTGETPSRWVYYVRHTIKQVGGKRFPEGILINGIMSWVGADNLYLASACQQSAAAQRKQAEDSPKVEQVKEEVRQMTDEERKALEAAAAEHDAQLLDTVVPAAPAAPATELAPETVAEASEPATSEAEVQPEPETRKDTLPQLNRFTIGLRGGAGSLMHDAEKMGNWRTGFDVLLDLQYAHYWLTNKQNAYGLVTGLSAGYVRSGLGSGVNDQYQDGEIEYSIKTADINEKDGQIQLEVPVMFSMIMHNGLFLNVGPKFVVPVYNHYNQKITDPHITAYFPTEGVTVSDEVITGMVQDNQMNTKGKWQSSRFNLMLTGELGYEWHLKNGHSLGLGAYANYSVFDLYKNDTENKSLIGVTAPSDNGPAVVNVFSATDTYAKGMGYWDCGLKLAYHFDFWKIKK